MVENSALVFHPVPADIFSQAVLEEGLKRRLSESAKSGRVCSRHAESLGPSKAPQERRAAQCCHREMLRATTRHTNDVSMSSRVTFSLNPICTIRQQITIP